ncbi:MAG TPA: ATP-dependent DNA helicase RecQ [Chryseosolibacter sp.]
MEPINVLTQYWKHSQFRPLQEDIVNSVIEGKDTLALLPTGGGKSVCFQVPGLILDGICIVISPLIALMKDQVEQLRQRDILAVAIHSGMSRHEIDVVLSNAMTGVIKFLYVSPERLQTEIFIERFKQMKVGLIAVDEAHCISQWGYDFRPPYLQIASLRDLRPDVPVIALTATATSEVQHDIVTRLRFKSDHNVFKKSFARDNLSFVVRHTENKDKKLIEILQKVKGSAIIYVRSRKATQDVAKFLNKKNIQASFYHAGLTFEERTARQEEWIKNHTRVMVATNAFGMGIDKPDVRVVIHLDLPDTLEAYYQEAGRAGRDGLRSFAAILYQPADGSNLLTKTEQSQPSIEFLSKVYQALSNYYQLAIGSAAGESFDFDAAAFSERFKFNPIELYNALKKLEEEGLIQFNESFYSPSRLHFELDHQKLYEFQVANAQFDPIIKTLLRLYGGEMFSNYMKISESYVAKGLKTTTADVASVLRHLDQLKVVSYLPVKDKPQVTFILPRQDAAKLPVDRERLAARKKLIVGKAQAVVAFVENQSRCRMQFVQEYFNEETDTECGICDICVEKRKKSNLKDYDTLLAEVLNVLKLKAYSVEELEQHIAPKDKELFIDVVRDLVDEGTLIYDSVWKLKVVGANR